MNLIQKSCHKSVLKILPLFLILLSLSWSRPARGQTISVGAAVGGLGYGESGGIGYGPLINVNPYDWAAFQIDFTMAHFENGTFFSSSPAVIFYPIALEEFLVGIMGGAGFYKEPVPDGEMQFGLNVGLSGEFSLAPSLAVGMQARYHPIISGDDNVWNVFLTFSYRFKGDGGW